MAAINPTPSIVDTVKGMTEALVSANASKDKSVIAFLGNTGSGKSTVINYLYGLPMRGITEHGTIEVDPSAKPLAIIGQNPVMSETRFASVYPMAGRKWSFLDTGGFLDTRGELASVTVPFSTKCALTNAKEVKLVLCVDMRLLGTDRGVHLTELFQTVMERLVSNLDDLNGSFFLLMTHVRHIETETGEFIPPTVEHVKTAFKIYREFTQSPLEQRVYDFILREDGKFIALFNPLDKGQTRDEVLTKLDEMPSIQKPRACFSRIPFSDKTALWIQTTMQTIAHEGVRIYEKLEVCKEKIESIKGNLECLSKRIHDLQQHAAKLGDSNPQVVQEAKNKVIASTEAEFERYEKLSENGKGKIKAIEVQITTLQQKQSILNSQNGVPRVYTSWSLIKPAIIIEEQNIDMSKLDISSIYNETKQGVKTGTEIADKVGKFVGGGEMKVIGGVVGGIVGAIKGFISQDRRTMRIPGMKVVHTGSFSCQGPLIYSLDISPSLSLSCWENRSGGVNCNEFAVGFKTAPGEAANAKITVNVAYENLPSTILEKERLASEVTSKEIQLSELRKDLSDYEVEIIRLNHAKKIASSEFIKAEELESQIKESENAKRKNENQRSSYLKDQESSMLELKEKENSFIALNHYLELNPGDKGLFESHVIKSYIRLRA